MSAPPRSGGGKERSAPPGASALGGRVLRFGAVGFSGVIVNLAALHGFADRLGVDPHASSALAIAVSIVWNFLLNNAWTFRDRNSLARAGFVRRMLRYNLVSWVGGGIQWVTFVVVTLALVRTLRLDAPGAWVYPAQLLGIALGTLWSFLSNFLWTWAQLPGEEPTRARLAPGG